jgi:hypothetical protein
MIKDAIKAFYQHSSALAVRVLRLQTIGPSFASQYTVDNYGELSLTALKVKAFARYPLGTAIHIAIHVD